jgi:hypothetical protein
MRAKRALFALLIATAAVLPALAVPEPTADELEHNRVLLDAWRRDPEHLARLRRDLKAFYDLPDSERDRLRRLSAELQSADNKTQTHLRGVMERYASWLERLPEADRQQIAASDRSDRVKVIRAIRDRQYLEQIPAKTREELAQLPASERVAQLSRLRAEDRELRRSCVRLSRVRLEPPVKPPAGPPANPPQLPRPTRLSEFPEDVRYYIDNVLWKQLTPAEAAQFTKAEGAPWPLLARTVLDLSEKHPVKLPGPIEGPRNFVDLPGDVKKAMPMKDLLPMQRRRLNELNGRWPDFAIEYVAIAHRTGVTLPRQLGPCHPGQFDLRVAQFINRTLLPKLNDMEKADFKAAEGKWPDYPRLLVEMAKKHGLEVPLMRLPGPRELWEQARAN